MHHLLWRILKDEHYLEERSVAPSAFPFQFGQKLLERQFLMRKRFERCKPRPLQKFPKGRIAGKVAPHDQSIDKATDQNGKIRIVSSSDRSADGYIVGAGVSPK